jgi:hypothetical protein
MLDCSELELRRRYMLIQDAIDGISNHDCLGLLMGCVGQIISGYGKYDDARAEGSVVGGLQTATNRPSDETAPCP